MAKWSDVRRDGDEFDDIRCGIQPWVIMEGKRMFARYLVDSNNAFELATAGIPLIRSAGHLKLLRELVHILPIDVLVPHIEALFHQVRLSQAEWDRCIPTLTNLISSNSDCLELSKSMNLADLAPHIVTDSSDIRQSLFLMAASSGRGSGEVTELARHLAVRFAGGSNELLEAASYAGSKMLNTGALEYKIAATLAAAIGACETYQTEGPQFLVNLLSALPIGELACIPQSIVDKLALPLMNGHNCECWQRPTILVIQRLQAIQYEFSTEFITAILEFNEACEGEEAELIGSVIDGLYGW
jgi:hypothetical protein